MFGVCKYLYDWNTRKLLGVLWISWDVVAFSNPMELILVFKIIYFHDYFLVRYCIYTALNITRKQFCEIITCLCELFPCVFKLWKHAKFKIQILCFLESIITCNDKSEIIHGALMFEINSNFLELISYVIYNYAFYHMLCDYYIVTHVCFGKNNDSMLDCNTCMLE